MTTDIETDNVKPNSSPRFWGRIELSTEAFEAVLRGEKHAALHELRSIGVEPKDGEFILLKEEHTIRDLYVLCTRSEPAFRDVWSTPSHLQLTSFDRLGGMSRSLDNLCAAQASHRWRALEVSDTSLKDEAVVDIEQSIAGGHRICVECGARTDETGRKRDHDEFCCNVRLRKAGAGK